MPKSDKRIAAMAALRVDGMTLAEVGAEFGLTRERVRQLLVKGGYEPGRIKNLAAAKRRRRLAAALQNELNAHGPAIRRLLLDGESLSTTATRLGVSPRAIGAIDQELGGLARATRARYLPKYTDAEVLDCLREANKLVGGILSGHDYDTVADGRNLADGREWPGRQTAILRFGSWRDALLAAGLPHNTSSGVRGRRLFEREHCIDAILEVTRAVGRLPSPTQYDAYAQKMSGVLPSVSTIRHRLGGWTEALRAAARFNAMPPEE